MGVLARKLLADDASGPNWEYVGVSSVASSSSGNITLTEPAGVQEDDLLVCIISYRSNEAFTSPGAPWVKQEEQNTGNTTAASSASKASGVLFYCIRGASAPGLTFTRTSGNVARAYIVAYRGVDTANPLVDSSSTTLSVAAGASTSSYMVVSGVTTANDKDLIVYGLCGARNGTHFSVFATDPATINNTADQTRAPVVGEWSERIESGTTTGADTRISIHDALRGTAGATGDISCVQGWDALHVGVVAAFKGA